MSLNFKCQISDVPFSYNSDAKVILCIKRKRWDGKYEVVPISFAIDAQYEDFSSFYYTDMNNDSFVRSISDRFKINLLDGIDLSEFMNKIEKRELSVPSLVYNEPKCEIIPYRIHRSVFQYFTLNSMSDDISFEEIMINVKEFMSDYNNSKKKAENDFHMNFALEMNFKDDFKQMLYKNGIYLDSVEFFNYNTMEFLLENLEDFIKNILFHSNLYHMCIKFNDEIYVTENVDYQDYIKFNNFKNLLMQQLYDYD